MKKLSIFLVLVIASVTVKAQIDLEQTYTASFSPVYGFVTNSNGIMYISVSDSSQVSIYNQDYSLYKTITINRPVGYRMSITYTSEHLFNTNNSIEFLCTFFKQEGGYATKYIISDENASVIKDFGTYNFIGYINIVSNGGISKLLIRGNVSDTSRQYVSEIYSLPGSLPTKIQSVKSAGIQPAYPNPSNTIINLLYKLDNGQNSTMHIYNSGGQLIEQKQIDSTFDRILLNVDSYKPGIYIYSCNGVSNRFVVE